MDSSCFQRDRVRDAYLSILSKEDVNGSEGRVWLVCNVVGDGNYQALASEFSINKSVSRTDVSAKNRLSFRKPLGVAATEITDGPR